LLSFSLLSAGLGNSSACGGAEFSGGVESLGDGRNGRRDLLALSAFSWANFCGRGRDRERPRRSIRRVHTYICTYTRMPRRTAPERAMQRWIRLRDRKSVSGCRLAPRVSAFSRSRSETNGFGGGGSPGREEPRREGKRRERERERDGKAIHTTPGHAERDTPARRSIASATEIYRLNNAVDNYARRTWREPCERRLPSFLRPPS